jgi:hypothetical protein
MREQEREEEISRRYDLLLPTTKLKPHVLDEILVRSISAAFIAKELPLHLP